MGFSETEIEGLQAELNAWRDRARQLELTLRKIETALGKGRSLEELERVAQAGGVAGETAALALLVRKVLTGVDGRI